MEEILYLERKNPSKTIKGCCKEILRLIPEKARYAVFIADLDPGVADNLKRRAADKSISPDDLAESSLARSLGRENIEEVPIKDGRHIKIALTGQGRGNLGDIAEKEGVPLTGITNRLLCKNGPDCGQICTDTQAYVKTIPSLWEITRSLTVTTVGGPRGSLHQNLKMCMGGRRVCMRHA